MGRPVQGMDVGEPRGVAIVSGHRTATTVQANQPGAAALAMPSLPALC